MLVKVDVAPEDLVGSNGLDVDYDELDAALAAEGKDMEWLCGAVASQAMEWFSEAVANHDFDLGIAARDSLWAVGVRDF